MCQTLEDSEDYIFLCSSGNRECYGKLVVYASEGFPSIQICSEEDSYLGRKHLFPGINITFLCRTERLVRRKPCIQTYNILMSFPARKIRWGLYKASICTAVSVHFFRLNHCSDITRRSAIMSGFLEIYSWKGFYPYMVSQIQKACVFCLEIRLLYDTVGTAVAQWLRCYKSEGRWFDSRWCHWNFSLT